MPRRPDPTPENQRAANERKAAVRLRDGLVDQLRNLGARRIGHLLEGDRIAAAVADLAPKAAAAGVTYEELADLTGLSRARIGQILGEAKKEKKPKPSARPAGNSKPPAKRRAAAAPKPKAEPGLVAAVADL